ncbi:DUF3221 domain-containing protein [Priestia taiwanensis]|uniref:Uncharacterized protein n=1 Tax=Priestia taiwanensis TaxID=1347902 RepID=A0A917ASC8_9BACI|nr:DUF3221 domain-containing protein [Priestia taiwanensis]MBM7363292.1 hypothetical protein [Priestia taiwanensis]GGE69231.1 hypothetical protein GCM10007140_19110 [Priestia taiwanensis]
MRKWLIRIGATCILLIICIALLMSKVDRSDPIELRPFLLEGYAVLKENRVFFEEQKGEAHSFLVFPNQQMGHDLQTGDKVKVWARHILESYPGKIIVDTYEKVD